MGYDYQLRFTEANKKYTTSNVNSPTHDAIDQLLRAAPTFHGCDDGHYAFKAHQDRVDARAWIEDYGISLSLDTNPHPGPHGLFNHLVLEVLHLYAGVEVIEV